MKKFVMTMALTLISNVALATPSEDGAGGNRESHRAHMNNELNLSDEQVQQMREIREQGGTREEARVVMTDEQRTKMDGMRKEHKGRSARRVKRMKEYLELSDKQVSQMQNIRERGGSREEMHAVLTDDQRDKLVSANSKHGGGEGKSE